MTMVARLVTFFAYIDLEYLKRFGVQPPTSSLMQSFIKGAWVDALRVGKK
jgi:hypothetical protein